MVKSVIFSVVAVLGLAGASFATDGHVQRVEKVRVVEKVVQPQKVRVIERVVQPYHEVVEYREVPNLRIERVIVNGHHQKNVQSLRVERVRDVQKVERVVQKNVTKRGRVFGRR